MKKWLSIIFTLAFLLRLVGLNQSLWLDEGTTARVVRTLSYGNILTKFSPNDFHPPFYYLLMKFWTNIFGYSEISLRMPSVIFSLAAGWVVYLIGKVLKDKTIGIWSATFFLFNPLIVYYSQEARMYMMATFFLTVAMYYFIRLLRVSGFSFFICLSFITFYGSIFFIVPMLVYLLYRKKYKLFILTAFYLLLTTLFLAPLLFQQLLNAKISLQQVTNWSLVLGKANLKNLFLIPIKFSFGRISFYPKILYYMVAGTWTTFVWFFVIKGGLKNKLLLFLAASSLAIGLIFSFFTPLLQYFRFLYLIPIMSILLSFGLLYRTKFNRSGWIGWMMAGGFVVLSLIYLFNPAFHREDWKSLARSFPAGKPIYMIVASSDALTYYDRNLVIRELTHSASSWQASLRVGEEKIIVIPYASEIYGFDYKTVLRKKEFKLTGEKNLRGVSYEIWNR